MAFLSGRGGVLSGAAAGFVLALVIFAGVWTIQGHEGGASDSTTAKVCNGQLPAFPGAEGFGCSTPGGRGGRIFVVTTLNDEGPGSLRAALEASGQRFVVFEVSGTIDIREQIEVDDPYVTVAGQTSPGGGITLRAAAGNTNGLVDISTHDVVIRFLRFRAGAHSAVSGENLDGINIWRPTGHHVIIDHNSFSWAVDENASIWDDAHAITFSWNIIAQGLRESTHPDGEHSKGLLVSGDATRDISVHHNLFTHNTARNPQVSSPGRVQVVNNVIFNYGDSALQSSNPYGAPQVDIVGNYFKAGPDSDPERYEIDAYPIEDVGTWSLHVEGNVGPHDTSGDSQTNLVSPEDRSLLVDDPPQGLTAVTTTSASQALEDVLSGAGARVPYLDPVDEQMIDDVRDERGGMINDESEVGGWPTLPSTEPPADGDSDGMPDGWEAGHRLDPKTDDSAEDADGNGYTNIEDYVNHLVRQLPPN